MHKFTLRIKSFLERASWLGRYCGGFASAVIYLIRIKLGSFVKGHGRYKGFDFRFSQNDLSAIREVLADEEYSFLSDTIKKGDAPLIVDLGSNIGLFALWSFSLNPKSQIMSVEASPETHKTLSENIELSHDKGLLWSSLHAAAWSTDGHVSFSTDGESMGHKVEESGSRKIPSLCYRSLMDKIKEKFGKSEIDILKIDIEGSEEPFLVSEKLNLDNVKNLIIELHPEKCNSRKVHEFLENSFKSVKPLGNRASRKPLLLCTNEAAS